MIRRGRHDRRSLRQDLNLAVLVPCILGSSIVGPLPFTADFDHLCNEERRDLDAVVGPRIAETGPIA